MPSARRAQSAAPYRNLLVTRHSSLVTSRKSDEDLRRWHIGVADFGTKKNSASQEFRASPELTKLAEERSRGRLLPLRRFCRKNFGIVGLTIPNSSRRNCAKKFM